MILFVILENISRPILSQLIIEKLVISLSVIPRRLLLLSLSVL